MEAKNSAGPTFLVRGKTMIQFKNVVKEYQPARFKAVDDVSFSVAPGELMVLIGPSGSGKTTCLKMINRLIDPTEGTILMDGKDIASYDPVELRRHIGYVVQHIGLMPHMTIGENIALVPKLSGWDAKKRKEIARELIALVDLPEDYLERYPSQLSGGQQQRIGVIRALAADPPVILMDEPFSALDPVTREQLQEELLRIQTQMKKSIVFVTHNMPEAVHIADRICILRAGKIEQIGTPDHILRNPANDFIAQFMGEQKMNVKNDTQHTDLPAISEIMLPPIVEYAHRGLAEGIARMRSRNVDSLILVDKGAKFVGVARVREMRLRYPEENLTLMDVAITNYPSATLNDPLDSVIAKMHQAKVPMIPILNEKDRRVLGAVTRACLVEVMHRQLQDEGGQEPWSN